MCLHCALAWLFPEIFNRAFIVGFLVAGVLAAVLQEMYGLAALLAAAAVMAYTWWHQARREDLDQVRASERARLELIQVLERRNEGA